MTWHDGEVLGQILGLRHDYLVPGDTPATA
jgi:hypothetical protein